MSPAALQSQDARRAGHMKGSTAWELERGAPALGCTLAQSFLRKPRDEERVGRATHLVGLSHIATILLRPTPSLQQILARGTESTTSRFFRVLLLHVYNRSQNRIHTSK